MWSGCATGHDVHVGHVRPRTARDQPGSKATSGGPHMFMSPANTQGTGVMRVERSPQRGDVTGRPLAEMGEVGAHHTQRGVRIAPMSTSMTIAPRRAGSVGSLPRSISVRAPHRQPRQHGDRPCAPHRPGPSRRARGITVGEPGRASVEAQAVDARGTTGAGPTAVRRGVGRGDDPPPGEGQLEADVYPNWRATRSAMGAPPSGTQTPGA